VLHFPFWTAFLPAGLETLPDVVLVLVLKGASPRLVVWLTQQGVVWFLGLKCLGRLRSLRIVHLAFVAASIVQGFQVLTFGWSYLRGTKLISFPAILLISFIKIFIITVVVVWVRIIRLLCCINWCDCSILRWSVVPSSLPIVGLHCLRSPISRWWRALHHLIIYRDMFLGATSVIIQF
jgi:hypothetical protein